MFVVRAAAAVLGALLFVCVVGSRADAQLLTPGPLSRAHADLDDDDHCDKCHESKRRVSNPACLACHSELAGRINKGKGLHSSSNYKGKNCGECHVEHHGRDTALIRWPGGKLTGLDHKQTGWPLNGAHAKVKCEDCHKRRTAKGAPTYLGLQTSCTSCHKDPHEGRFGAECTSCHNETRWQDVNVDKFDHTKTAFPLRGKHGTVQCVECHGVPPKYKGIPFQNCVDCHKDPHEGRLKGRCESCHVEQGWKTVNKVRARHPWLSLEHGHSDVACRTCHDAGGDRPPKRGSRCVSCHKPVHEAKFGNDCNECHASIEWLGLPETVGRGAHVKTPFPLRGKHEAVACAKCHDPKRPADKRYRALKFDACRECHRDVHEGTLKKYLGGDCEGCHHERGFAPSTFTVSAHAKTAYALEGRHEAVPCSGCHGQKLPRVKFKNPKRECAECHDNPHGDQFAKEMVLGGCAHCHSPRDWHSPKFDHSTWPLTGAHGRAACGSCHKQEGDKRADALKNPAVYRGVPRDCIGCHDDVHAGQFRLNAPVRDCASCHSTEKFKIKPFDHAKTTGYALEEAHTKLKCEQCHAHVTLASGAKSTRYRLGYRDCADCHANPHGDIGAAKARPTSATPKAPAASSTGFACNGCHTQTAWRLSGGLTAGSSGFDHSRTGFPLTGAHRSTTCIECHKPGHKVSRECSSCHADVHAGRLSDHCDGCHNAATWNSVRAIELHRKTLLPLTGMHALADCTECHQRTSERTWTSVPAACFACHAEEYRSAATPVHTGDPNDPSQKAFPRDCELCHRPIAWRPVLTSISSVLNAQALTARKEHSLRFPLTAAGHRNAPCESCHTNLATPRVVMCASCHRQPDLLRSHSRVSAAANLRATDATSCLHCHQTGRR